MSKIGLCPFRESFKRLPNGTQGILAVRMCIQLHSVEDGKGCAAFCRAHRQ